MVPGSAERIYQFNHYKSMQNTLHQLIKFMSMQCLIVFLIQVLTIEILIAEDTHGQGIADTRLTLSCSDHKLIAIFKQIEDKTEFVFAYPDEIRKDEKRYSFNFKDETLENILKYLSEKGGVRFKVVQTTITAAFDEDVKAELTNRKEIAKEINKEIAVSGKVSDETGAGVPGVNILVKGTNIGTTTDAEGVYTVAVPDQNAVLVFSFIGFVTKEVPVGAQTVIDVTLESDVTQLGEVVIVGYGEKKSANLTGAVETVGSEVIESRPIVNTGAAIQGAVPGLVVQRGSGQPGTEGFDFKIRGYSSANGKSDPLLLIDGIAVEDLNLLNPSDIESISVLKDAQASIYGARAANGVILVTTKRGHKTAPKLTYSGNVATTKLAGMMDTPNHYQFAVMDNEANIHNGASPMYTPDLLERVRIGDPNPIPHPVYGSSGWMLFFTSTDWREAVFENGFQQKHMVSLSGGGEKSTYYLSGSYADQRGVIKYGDDNSKRYNLRMNYDYDISKRFRLETKVSLENLDRTDIGGATSAGVMYETIFGMPNHPVYTQSGTKYFAQGGWGNAVAQAREAATASFITRNVNTNFKLITELAEGLKLNLQTGINFRTSDDTDIGKSYPLYRWDESSIAYYSIANPDQDWMTENHKENTYRNFTGYLQYNKIFNTKHEVDVMAGASHEENTFDEFSAGRTNFVVDDVWALRLGSSDNMTNSGGGSHWAIRSFFSRLSYVLNNRYMVEANLRYDGSSRFADDTRWGLFPGISAGWRLSEEDFIRDLNVFDNLKIRLSYGETGNQDAVGLYDYIQSISIGRESPYPFGAGGQDQSAYLSGMVSSDRTWETIATTNAGLDVSVLKSRLDFTFDYFVRKNIDMLVPIVYPSLLGAVPPYTNAGSMKTSGFEASLGWKDNVGGVQYSARAILSDAKNEMTDLGGQDTYVLGLNGPQSPEWWNSQSLQPREGYPINSYFAYEFDGVIRSQEELDAYKQLGGVPSDIGIGDAKFKDINGDGKISLYSDVPGQDGDVIYAGNTFPRYSYGLNVDLKWKGFDLAIFLQGVGKRTLFRYGEYSMPWSDWWRQPPLFYYGQTWNEDRPDAEYPRLSHGSIRYWNYQPSTLQAVNAAYIRLKNLQVGYTIPTTLLSKFSISTLRVYFSGFDLWEKHNVKGGWDPESNQTGYNYPFQRLYSFGLDVTF
jgi:TonB-linked SusC/RagA family outer membrane protein